MKEIGENLNKKTLYLTILIKIRQTYSKFINKMLIFLWILFMDFFLNFILDAHAPLRKVHKYKLKFKTKPWITPALQKSIFDDNNLLKKIISAKDSQVKEKHHKEYKNYRNMHSTILKQSKTNYYNHYFETNWNSIKTTREGIKSILNIKNISANILKSLAVDDTTISNPVAISNIFNNYFSSITNNTKHNISI